MLRTTVAGSAIRVEKLRAGVPPDDESRYFHGNPALLTLAIPENLQDRKIHSTNISTIDYAPAWAFRHAAGGRPTSRRNARENAASES